jgi:transglutaminase superfamily protein
MKRFLKFWSLPRREKQFFCEAGILLLLSNFCVRAIAFRHIESFLRARWSDDTPRGYDQAGDIKLVNLSLARAANLLPWESLCLSRSVAAFIMLRRRGIPAVLYAGVKFLEDSSLTAHAWVRTSRGAIEANSENSAFTVIVRIGQ